MKLKNKGKVYPSPSSSSSLERDGDVLSVLKLLPAAILALASILSLEDREVLAYMITRSLKTTTNSSSSSSSSLVQDSKKKASKKSPNNILNSGNNLNSSNGNLNSNNHKAPMFGCDCFDCYTSYWFRWDSSPNRELIHQVIEAFEEYLISTEQSKKNPRGKRRDKTARRLGDDKAQAQVFLEAPTRMEAYEASSSSSSFPSSTGVALVSPDDDVSAATPPDKAADGEKQEDGKVNQLLIDTTLLEEAEDMAVVLRSPAAAADGSHKGLARKVLPDVLGLLNSRLWSLWGPNV